MSKPEEKRSPRGESSDANTLHEIATKWALEEVGHPNTLIIEGLTPEEATRAKSIRNSWFDRFIQGMWRGEFTGLFLEYPPDGTEEDMVGGVWLDTNDDDGALTAERDRQPIDRDLLWEMLKLHGLPQGVRRDAPDFDVLAGISAADYSEVARVSLLEKIKIGQKGFLRWCGEQNITPPPLTFGGRLRKQPFAVDKTIGAETNCKKWLVGLMTEGAPTKNKDAYRQEAVDTFKVGTRAFDRAWANAVGETGNTEWSHPGPKS